MKRTIALMAALMLTMSFALSALTEQETVSAESIRAEVVDCRMELNSQTGYTVISAKTKLINDAPTGVMEIQYLLTVVDAQGKALSQLNMRFNGLDTPIAPGEYAVHEAGWQERLEGEPHHVEVKVKEVFSEEEMPPVHLPQPGETLCQALPQDDFARLADELPVTLTMWIDHGGAEEIATLTDSELIREAVALLMDVKIAGETVEWVTDNYNGLCFAFADGTESIVSLNLRNLEIRVYNELKLYELENLKPFWDFMSGFTVSEGLSDSADS